MSANPTDTTRPTHHGFLSQNVDAEKAKAMTVGSHEAEAHEGVLAIEATHQVFGKYSKWALFIRCVALLVSQYGVAHDVYSVWVWRRTFTRWMVRPHGRTLPLHYPHLVGTA